MARLRALSMGGSGVTEWPLPAGGGAMPALQTIDLRGGRIHAHATLATCAWLSGAGTVGLPIIPIFQIATGTAEQVLARQCSPHCPRPPGAYVPSLPSFPPDPKINWRAGNPLAPIPPGGLRCCPELRSVDLSGAPAAAVAAMPPALLAAAPKLEAVSLANCRAAAAPWEALRRAAASLRRLDLSGNSLEGLPALVSEFTR
jgi:hypothetical protein